jgi:hypothetical protein
MKRLRLSLLSFFFASGVSCLNAGEAAAATTAASIGIGAGTAYARIIGIEIGITTDATIFTGKGLYHGVKHLVEVVEKRIMEWEYVEE